MKSKNSNNIVKELISLAYMNFLRLLKTIKNHQIKFLKSCGHCGRSGSTPLPGTKHSDLSGCFFIFTPCTLYISFNLRNQAVTMSDIVRIGRNDWVSIIQGKQLPQEIKAHGNVFTPKHSVISYLRISASWK